MENTNTGRKKYKIAVAACVIFAIAAIVLAALLSVYVLRAGDARIDAENNYRAAYFELLDSMLDIETDLSKMKVASTDAMQTELMLDTAINAELAGQSLSALVRDEYQLEPTIKFCNQLQDFAKYIVKKIDREQPLTDKDYESLDDLHEAALELGRRLAAMGDGMREDGYYFIEAIGEDDPFRDIVDGVEDSAVQYPSLIYDGPFSDGLEDPEPHALKGEEVTREQAAQKAKEYLSEYDVTEVEFTAEANGYFESYMYSFATADGKTGTVQLSKTGGHLVMFDIYEEMVMPTFSKDEGVEVAKIYCRDHGYDGMTAVWSTVSDSELFVNLCYERDGIVFYPDMVKVKVSLQTGKVIGFEALQYIYNHDREDEVDYAVELTEEEVRAVYRDDFEIESVRLAVIPTGGGEEKLCYEVYGECDGDKYFVFVDAETGYELEVMQVIDGDDGELLM